MISYLTTKDEGICKECYSKNIAYNPAIKLKFGAIPIGWMCLICLCGGPTLMHPTIAAVGLLSSIGFVIMSRVMYRDLNKKEGP